MLSDTRGILSLQQEGQLHPTPPWPWFQVPIEWQFIEEGEMKRRKMEAALTTT